MATIDTIAGLDPKSATRFRKSRVRTTEALLKRGPCGHHDRRDILKHAGKEGDGGKPLINPEILKGVT